MRRDFILLLELVLFGDWTDMGRFGSQWVLPRPKMTFLRPVGSLRSSSSTLRVTVGAVRGSLIISLALPSARKSCAPLDTYLPPNRSVSIANNVTRQKL